MTDTPIFAEVVRWQARQEGARYVRDHLKISVCSTCGTTSGEPCRTAGGRDLRHPHKARRHP